MRRSLALFAGSALLVPTALLAAPAEAATAATQDTIQNCSKTRHGVTVRIKMRDNGDFTRVRVSHPRGSGNFYAPKVRRVEGAIAWTGDTPPPSSDGGQLGGGASIERVHTLSPSFRAPTATGATVSLSARFILRSGKSIPLSCTLR
jgi:hypothetical protein